MVYTVYTVCICVYVSVFTNTNWSYCAERILIFAFLFYSSAAEVSFRFFIFPRRSWRLNSMIFIFKYPAIFSLSKKKHLGICDYILLLGANLYVIVYFAHRFLTLKGLFYFFRPRYNITESRNGYIVQLNVIIHNLTKNDFDTYMCVASSSMGRADVTIRVYGKYLP